MGKPHFPRLGTGIRVAFVEVGVGKATAPTRGVCFDMIKLTRFDGSELAVNAELVKFIEAAPDTIVTLTSDQKILVLETVEEVIDRIIRYRKLAYSSLPEVRDRSEEEIER